MLHIIFLAAVGMYVMWDRQVHIAHLQLHTPCSCLWINLWFDLVQGFHSARSFWVHFDVSFHNNCKTNK